MLVMRGKALLSACNNDFDDISLGCFILFASLIKMFLSNYKDCVPVLMLLWFESISNYLKFIRNIFLFSIRLITFFYQVR